MYIHLLTELHSPVHSPRAPQLPGREMLASRDPSVLPVQGRAQCLTVRDRYRYRDLRFQVRDRDGGVRQPVRDDSEAEASTGLETAARPRRRDRGHIPVPITSLSHISQVPSPQYHPPRDCKNRPVPFPGRMPFRATKPGSVCPVS